MEISQKQIVQACLDAASLLPRQGPITKFAFLNPLQGLEHEHFDQVMQRVGAAYGNQAFLDDGRYRKKMGQGKIVEGDLREVLEEELESGSKELVAGLTPRGDLRLAMLVYPLHFGLRRELDWVLAETEALKLIRPEVSPESKSELLGDFKEWIISCRPTSGMAVAADVMSWSDEQTQQYSNEGFKVLSDGDWEAVYLRTLWGIIKNGVELNLPASPWPFSLENSATACDGSLLSHQSLAEFLQTTADPRVDAMMIQFTSAFLDQGYAPHPLPGIEQGYWNCFKQLYARPSTLAPRWRRELSKILNHLDQSGKGPLDSIQNSLKELERGPEDFAAFLAAALLSLRGYAGMIWQTETRPDLFRRSTPAGTLVEFAAVRLLLLTQAKKFPEPVPAISSSNQALRSSALTQIDSEQLAYLLFELAQVLKWSPQKLLQLQARQWQELCVEMHEFGDHQRRKTFHAAMERRLAKMALRAFWLRTRHPPLRPAQPSLQIITCIDAREESLRRHIEELDSTVETFGIAGFFGIPMYYRGAGDADFSALCPIVMKPKHWVTEEAVYSLEQTDRTRAKARRFLGSAQRGFQSQSRSFVGGAIMSTLVGPLATIPMLSRILLPRTTALMNQTASQFIAPPSITRLQLERASDCQPSPPSITKDGSLNTDGVGFTLEEMSQFAERALRDIGLTSSFAPLVLILGHGSSCINNPHESAYHCGACAGNAGGPNARALAMMLNDVRVRRRLADIGLIIPEETQFIGGLHNTATEEMMFFDLELLPTRKVKQVRAASHLLAEAARRNARERCRRFESASLEISDKEALLHVQNRSEDLAQTRPEYGNGSNALCFVGRRERIRGLYLDRRSFLMSYDPTLDSAEAAILTRILAAVVPVCEGINLLYTFSAIDPSGWGSGTKLPHNITSLVGVMDGAASDLRTGLPWQGVDIHEPLRLLFIIEAAPQTLLKLMNENGTLKNIFRNHWSHLAALDPVTNQIYRFSKDRFVLYQPAEAESDVNSLPSANDSHSWYRGKRDHLPFAIIGDLLSKDIQSTSHPILSTTNDAGHSKSKVVSP
jgi:uncharacterized protein